ncbi:hypothetical protein [Frankia sp. R82]|uniref:hypothetical protein n=1 Tax=Frankia sp. R82 TaxID=2950553 RepID=UPI002042C29F|nr:hypothetical protein [Frankia sp. R82]MCM3885776.1 hypothetical protein [Frankia sp. R82]
MPTTSTTDPVQAEPDPHGSAEPSAPAPGERPPLRPVDWDGSSSRTWAARDDQEVANRLSARYDYESAQRELAELMREQSDPRQRLFDRLAGFGRVFDDEKNGPAPEPDDSSGSF